ncbi:MAG: FtsX-like permease family protein [Blautia sp.]
MLFNLSRKNFKKSIRDYSVYFFTLILGVAVFYIFNAIETQTAMMEVTKAKVEIIDMMNSALEAVSIFVSFILGYLIVYASRFMLKKRKKEFAVYLTLGMKKTQISGMLWIETVFMGIISLGVGLLVGIGLSQFMSLFVSKIFEADLSKFVFTVSGKAIVKSVFYFLVIYIVVMILGYAYHNVTGNAQALTTEVDVFTQIILGIIGTFLVFWSVSGFFAAMAGKASKVYYKGLNSFAVGEISNKLNSMVASATIICLLLFMTVCIITSVFTRKAYKDKLVDEMAPMDISMEKYVAEDHKTIADVFEEKKISMDAFCDITEAYSLQSEEITNAAVLGDYLLENAEFYGEEFANAPVEVMKVGDYNKFAKRYNKKTYSLKEDEYLIVANQEGSVKLFNSGLKENQEISFQGKTYRAKEKACQDGFVMMNYDKYNMGILLLPDEADFSQCKEDTNYIAANYKNDSKKFRTMVDKQISNNMKNSWEVTYPVVTATRSNIIDDSIGTSAMYIFLGMYLGISFLLSGAAILSLKVLSDAADSKDKYEILRKLGCEERKIRGVLWKQNSMFFGLPVLVASIHSIFGIQVCNQLLSIYGEQSILPGLTAAVILVLFFYGGYFLIAQMCSLRIIRGEK